MEETGGTGENHRPVGSHEQTLPNNVISSTPCHERDSLLTTSVVIGTDCIGNCKSNYHTITATTALLFWLAVRFASPANINSIVTT